MIARIQNKLRRMLAPANEPAAPVQSPTHPIEIRDVNVLGRTMKLATTRADIVLGAMLRGEEPLCRFYQAELAWLKDQLRPGDTVLEAGGNIGSVAIALALHQPSAQIASFEPDPTNFGLFQVNLALNKCENIRAFNLALGDHEGMVQLYRSPGNFGDHRTTKPKGLDLDEDRFQALPNPVQLVEGSRFLDRFLPGWRPNMAKIDTQGADFEILGDLMPIFAPGAKIGIEFSPYHLDTHGTTFAQIAKILEGFEKIYRIEPSPTAPYELIPVTIDELRVFFDAEKARYQRYFDLALYGRA